MGATIPFLIVHLGCTYRKYLSRFFFTTFAKLIQDFSPPTFTLITSAFYMTHKLFQLPYVCDVFYQLPSLFFLIFLPPGPDLIHFFAFIPGWEEFDLRLVRDLLDLLPGHVNIFTVFVNKPVH